MSESLPAGSSLPKVALPELYARWAGEFLPGEVPSEPKSTCDDCALCVKADGRLPTATYYFRPEAKCCVYTPRLRNFAIGRILADPLTHPQGLESVRARIRARAAVTPLGLDRTPAYDVVYGATSDVFGNSVGLRCPHFVDEGPGLCGIWRHRNSTCSTWFCRHERGHVSVQFWHALRELFSLAEAELSQWCALELGIAAQHLQRYLPSAGERSANVGPPQHTASAMEGEIDEAAYAGLWGTWLGREEEFFLACAEQASALDWEQVLAIAGPTLRARAAIARAGYERLVNPFVPERLRLGSFQASTVRRDGVRAVTFSSMDALDLPAALLPVLPLFDGRPTLEVLEELATDHGISIAPDLLQQLVDWDVLVWAPPAEG